MKKIFVSFLAVLTLYHFGISAFASSDFEFKDDVPLELPKVYDDFDFYSVSSASALGLTMGSIGGSSVVTGVLGSLAPVLGVMGALVGGYVVVKGLSNVISTLDLSMSLGSVVSSSDVDFDYNISDDKISISTSVKDSAKKSFLIGAYSNSFYASPDLGKEFISLNDPSVNMPFGIQFYINDLPSGVNFSLAVSSGGIQYMEFTSNPGSYFVYSNGRNTYFYNRFRFYRGDYSLVPFVNYFYGVEYIMDSNGRVTKPSDDKFSYWSSLPSTEVVALSTIVNANVQRTISSSELNDLYRQSVISEYQKNMTYDMPISHILALNPDLTFENGFFTNKDTGEVVDTLDVVVPFPDTFNPSTGLEFSSALDSALSGSIDSPSDTPSVDTSGILGFLSSILDSILSLPSLIANAFTNFFENVINAIKAIPDAFMNVLGAISTAIGNTWEWCQGLPNLLGELLNALGSAITGVFTGVLSGILTGVNAIVDFFANILSFVMSLVIPQSGFFVSELSELGDIFVSKFPFFGQVGDIIKAFKFDLSAKLPEFKITVPNHIYGGGTYHVITFDSFVQYRLVILNFIRLFTWFPFIIRMYKKSVYMATGH